ncbi:MAG: Ig-like domain-containing protein, partial [Planctomycetaceae bacterium]
QTVTVEGTNEGGSAQITRNVTTLFTGVVTNVAVTGTSLLEPTASWDAPTGEGAELVARYKTDGVSKWGVGRTRKTHRVSYNVAASETSVLMPGLVRGKSYALTITALNSTTDPGLANTGTSFVSSPALPQVRWTVNGFSDGLSVPGPVVAGQPAEIVLADQRPDPSDIELLSGPAGLTFDPTTKTAEWTPDAEDVNTGYTNTNVTFRATNTVGSVDITVPVHVYFSGAVKNLQATKYGTVAASASWDAPTDNVTPIAGYRVTMHWTWSGRRRSRSWTVDGDVTSISYSLVPTGAVSHKGVSITPIDTDDNFGVDSGKVLYGQRANNLPPIAVNDAYDVTEDTTLNVDFFSGIRANDIDTDNTPFFNPLSARLVSGPANGTLSLNTLGSFDYIPDANFNGVDTFTYLVNDGKFDSNVATVTLNVAAVNDTPSALDDYYTVDQDGSLTVGVATGVQANDSDVDGGTLTASVVANPTNGSVTLSGDGSFVYTPAVGFTGDDTFTYVVNDTLVDSRVATVNITVNATDPPPPPGTRFYVVDFSGRATFEYDTTGDLVETYALPKANKKPLGVAANADGSLVWTIDKQKRVFIYDDSGTRLGMWVPEGLTKPDGIATDGTDIWIVDRSADKVLYYADGAARRNGTAAPTSDFALDRTNRNPKGITSDGTSVWIVNDTKNADRVFRYDTTGSLLGRWKIDSLNAKPTGITIDPNNVNDLWVVDSSADSVFQYSSAATRLKGTQTADVVFELDNANTNPQGIADPKPSGTQAVSRTSVALEVIRPDQSSIFVSQPERNRLARTTIKRQFPTAQRGSLEPRLSLDGPVLADPRVGLGAAHDQMLLDTLFARSSDFLAILDSQMVID